MSYRNFLDEIKKGLPLANYILVSSDPFLHTEALSLIKALIPDTERDFNLHAFDLQSNGGIPFEQILDVLNTVPFFSDRSARKFVIIENFQKLSRKDLIKLEQYISRPSESSVMILLNLGNLKKDTRDRLKGLRQITLDIRENEIPFWVKQKAKSRGFEILDNAVDYLLGTIGTDLGMLSSELDKLMLIGKSVIRKEDISEIIRGSRTYNPFDLVNAIRSKDTEKVFRIYKVLSETEEPYSLLGVLNWLYAQSIANKNSAKDKNFHYSLFSLLNKADIDIKSSGSSYPVELLLAKLLRLSKQH